MVATRARRRPASATAPTPEPIDRGEDGYEIRKWLVYNPATRQDEVQEFSLRPFTEEEREVYWNPIFVGQQMLWRQQTINEHGIQPVIQKEVWLDGKFSPRNAWERHMTREFLASLPGGEPDKWIGYNHPENAFPPSPTIPVGETAHHWRCECAWICGNYQAFGAHRRYLRHQESMSE